MKKELLETIRSEFLSEKKNKDKQQEMLSELAMLESNPIVIRYLTIKRELASMTTSPEDDTIITSIHQKYDLELSHDTNGIYFCIGSFGNNSSIKLMPYDSRVKYRIYMNIETDYDGYQIPIEDCEEFESHHQVIFPDPTLDGKEEYAKIKTEFLTTAVKEGQKTAIKRVLTRINKNQRDS